MREDNIAYRKLHLNHKKGEVYLSTVSGVASTKPELVRKFDREITNIDIITTKSFQVVPNPGNKPPVITSPKLGDFGNSVGLRNPGMEVAYPPLKEIREEGMRAILNVSLSASTKEDFLTLVKRFDDIADMEELNFSCPHAAKGFGASIGTDIEAVKEFVEYIATEYPERKSLLIIKLTPNVDNIGEIAKVAIEAGADGIAAINTVGPLLYEKDGKAILQNKVGGKGGASGEWVKEKAIECITEIREAIGDDPIILGMGGVSSAEDARRMLAAGADSVGIGSAIARVYPTEWNDFFGAVKNGEDTRKYLSDDHSALEYERHTIEKKVMYDEATVVLTLDGKGNCKAGEFVFLWIPGVGERPFSVAKNDPLSFIIKVRGEFTEKCRDLNVGDEIYIRGLCGKPIETKKAEKAILIGGGTGIVVLNLLAEELYKDGTKMDIRLGLPTAPEGKGLMQDDLEKYGKYTVVPDDGMPGRVLTTFDEKDVEGDTAIYVVGPTIMMKKAAERFMALGVKPERINISVETQTMCGIGMCGECVCGGRIPCKQGTFLSWDYIINNNVEL